MNKAEGIERPAGTGAPGRRIVLALATGFGLGRSPFAPGTVGSLPGLALALAIAAATANPWIQAVIAAALALAAVPVCDAAERSFASKDDRRIVADEFMTFPLCVIGLPLAEAPWLLPVALVINRVLDVVKPPPARQIQAWRGGAGIVADDAVSCLYALVANHLLYGWLTR